MTDVIASIKKEIRDRKLSEAARVAEVAKKAVE